MVGMGGQLGKFWPWMNINEDDARTFVAVDGVVSFVAVLYGPYRHSSPHLKFVTSAAIRVEEIRLRLYRNTHHTREIRRYTARRTIR